MLIIHKLEHSLRKHIIFKRIVIIKVHCLLCCIFVFIPLVIANCFSVRSLLILASCYQRWVHLQQLHYLYGRDVSFWHEFYQRQCIKTAEVSHCWVTTSQAVIAGLVDKGLNVDTTVAGDSKPFFILERFALDFQSFNFNLFDPLLVHFHS